MSEHRIYKISFSEIYPHYIAKAERKGRAKAEVDEIIRWLTGYSQEQLDNILSSGTTVKAFYEEAPDFNPNSSKITGVICGLRVEDIDDKLMQKIRYLDKLIDELAKGKPMDNILRG